MFLIIALKVCLLDEIKRDKKGNSISYAKIVKSLSVFTCKCLTGIQMLKNIIMYLEVEETLEIMQCNLLTI